MESPKHQLARLFESRLGVPISRAQIESLGLQLDNMKRIRRNGGARDILDEKGIALLWGARDRETIIKLGLGVVSNDEFIAYRPKNAAEWQILASARNEKVRPPR